MRAKKQFAEMHEECIGIVRGIKIKNDIINKKHGVESEAKLLQEIKKDKQFFENELTRLKTMMNRMEEDYIDPDSMRKLQMVKKEAQKQIKRNEQLMKNLISSSFAEIHSHEQNERHYQISMSNIKPVQPRKISSFNPYQNQQAQKQQNNKQQININEEPLVNYELEQTLNNQRNKVLKEVEQDFVMLNGIINQTAYMVHEQGEHLDIITDDIVRAKDNIQRANDNMIEAAEYQKQSKRKYIIFSLIIIFIILVIGVPIIVLA